MTDLTFLKALRDKLKGGNARSIHLNALPGRYATRLDVANLNYIRPETASDFFDLLFTKPCFEFKISFDGVDLNSLTAEDQKRLGLLSKRLNSLNIENEDNYKEHGIKTFGFGYPLLIKPSKQDPKKIIKAPLFIWQLEIIKATNKVNSWSILRNKSRNENGRIVDEEIHSVGLNEVLLSFIKADEGIAIPQVNEELLEDAVIDRDELLAECVKVLSSLNTELSSSIKENLVAKFSASLKNIPESDSIEAVSNNLPWIHFGGVFGLFRTQKESIISDIDRIIEDVNEYQFESLVVEPFNGTPLSAVQTDPSQQEILSTLETAPKKIIQGPPGTGKSQSLTALITNALANNLKCLVVCEKKTALEVIKNNLHKEHEQLGSLAAVIEDINKDRDSIVNSVRDRISSALRFNSDTAEYKKVVEKVEELVQTINRQHKQIDTPIFLGKNWTYSVGQYLHLEKQTDISQLKNRLDYKQFRFHKDESELPSVLSSIRTAKNLYAEVQTLKHPLETLNDKYFGGENYSAVQLELQKFTTKLIEEAGKLRLALSKVISEYSNWLNSHYSNLQKDTSSLKDIILSDIGGYQSWLDSHYAEYYTSLKNGLDTYTTFTKDNINEYGPSFYKNSNASKISTAILSLVSKKHKKLKENRKKLPELARTVKRLHSKPEYFQFTFSEVIEVEHLSIYTDDISKFSLALDEWYKSVPSVKEAYVRDFSSKNIHKDYANVEAILSTENKFIAAIKTFESDAHFSTDNLTNETHVTKLQTLTEILNRFNDIDVIKKSYLDCLSQSNLHFLCPLQEGVGQIQSEHNQFLSYLNRENLLKDPLSESSSFASRLKTLIELAEDILKIQNNLEDFRSYFEWRKFFISLPALHLKVVVALIEISPVDWEATFKTWYYFWVLSLNEHSNLPTNDTAIKELFTSKKNLKATQITNIIQYWSEKQKVSLKHCQFDGVNPTSLYNKRGSRGERRNSLRKIIATDFDLFTDFFPVVLVSPTVCSSLLPLKEGIFDLVIFDEASQLRLEDTFPALLRGKIKIISGDSQQMPPASYFQGGNTLLNPHEEEADEEMDYRTPLPQNKTINGSLILADSESLLAYAENCNYTQSYLKVHYRSQHPDLIEFSNHAFYGKRLIPTPAKKDYVPIQFVEVNGNYEEQVNRDEARQVVDILLNHIKPFSNGKYPSVGVATFNLYQRNLILEEITKARQLNPIFDKQIGDLGSDLFVKNLENIQGDERDVIIISTTFGKKSDGSFRQNFGPILQRNGYKLLNVIITRAKFKVFVCTSIPAEYINQYQNLIGQHGNTKITEVHDKLIAMVKDMQKNKSTALIQADHDALLSRIGTMKPNDTDEMEDDVPVSWEILNFYHLPTAGVITNISKMQSDLKNIEAEVVSQFSTAAGKLLMKFNRLNAEVVAPSSYIQSGEPYVANILLAASSTDFKDDNMQVILNPTSYDTATGKVEGGTVVPLEDGVGKFKESKGTGQQDYKGVIRFKEPSGDFKLYPFESKYTVAAPSVAVSPEKMNVFYIGVDNPVAVSAAGISPDKLIVNANGGGITLKPTSAGKYIVQATTETNDAKINVLAKTETGSKAQGSCNFRVKRIPDPIASIGGKRGTAEIKRIEAGNLSAVTAKVDNFDFEAPFKITFFEFTAIVRGQPVIYTSNGPGLTEDMKKALAKVTTGSKIFISDVKVIGPDHKERNIPGVNLKVKG